MIRLSFCLAATLLVMANSCVQYHYSPNFIQTPYLEKKGEAMVSASVSGDPTSVGGDFHASWSPVKNGTVMLNHYRNRSRFQDPNFFGGTTYLEEAKTFLVEAAAGGYFPLSFGTCAIYAGGGIGRSRNDYGIERIAKINMNRWFLQPTFTFKNDWFRIGMGMRLILINFPAGNIDYRIEPEDIAVIQGLENDGPFVFPEFGGNIGIHFKPVTISAHLVILPSPRALEYNFDGSNFGLGLSVDLHKLGKKQKVSEGKATD
jgi:hypothetical protein